MATPVEPGQPQRSFFQQHPVLLVLLCLAGLGLAAIVSNGNDSNSGRHKTAASESVKPAKADTSAELACGHLRNVAKDAGTGILNDTEFRDKIRGSSS